MECWGTIFSHKFNLQISQPRVLVLRPLFEHSVANSFACFSINVNNSPILLDVLLLMQKNCSILNYYYYYYWCILLFVYYFSININNSQKKIVLFWTRQLMAIWGAWWPWLPHRCQPAPVTSVTSQAVKPCETLRARCKHQNSWDLWMLPSGKLT